MHIAHDSWPVFPYRKNHGRCFVIEYNHLIFCHLSFAIMRHFLGHYVMSWQPSTAQTHPMIIKWHQTPPSHCRLEGTFMLFVLSCIKYSQDQNMSSLSADALVPNGARPSADSAGHKFRWCRWPLLTHWSYCSLALSHRCALPGYLTHNFQFLFHWLDDIIQNGRQNLVKYHGMLSVNSCLYPHPS